MKSKHRPDWAPDDCPDNVVQMIGHDQVIENLKLRGLASADSKTYHAAVQRLKWHLATFRSEGYDAGRKSNRWLVPLAFFAGLAAGAAGSAIFFLAFT